MGSKYLCLRVNLNDPHMKGQQMLYCCYVYKHLGMVVIKREQKMAAGGVCLLS